MRMFRNLKIYRDRFIEGKCYSTKTKKDRWLFLRFLPCAMRFKTPFFTTLWEKKSVSIFPTTLTKQIQGNWKMWILKWRIIIDFLPPPQRGHESHEHCVDNVLSCLGSPCPPPMNPTNPRCRLHIFSQVGGFQPTPMEKYASKWASSSPTFGVKIT